MNIIFAELEQKAHNYAASTFIESHGKQAEYNRLFIDKFAELIVRECMGICKKHPSRYPYNNWNADAVAPHLVQQFEEHFGVEE